MSIFSAFNQENMMNVTSKISLARYLDFSGRSVLSQFFWITVFAAGTALGARVEIPHEPVPFTLQTLVVLLAGACLGPRNGSISQLLYLASGALGAPAFAGGSFGFAKLIGPTGGYLIAFPIAAALVGYLVQQKKTLLWHILAMLIGLLAIFISGTLQLYAFYIHDFSKAVQAGFLIFTWWDLIKLLAAAATYHEIAKRWPNVPG